MDWCHVTGIIGTEWNKEEPFFCPDKSPWKFGKISSALENLVLCGAIIELRANGIPSGLHAYLLKLDADILAGLMSINAVKGVNIGSGMNSAYLSGEENSDEMRSGSGKVNLKQ